MSYEDQSEYDISEMRQETISLGSYVESSGQSKGFKLPWWCLPVIWFLLFATMGIALTFVFFYGVMFGEFRCRLWLSSLLFAFISNAILVHPVKVHSFIINSIGRLFRMRIIPIPLKSRASQSSLKNYN